VPNDAKLGMVVGVALVMVFAVAFFRKDTSAAAAPDGPRAVTPAPRMSGGRAVPPGPAAPRPAHRIAGPAFLPPAPEGAARAKAPDPSVTARRPGRTAPAGPPGPPH